MQHPARWNLSQSADETQQELEQTSSKGVPHPSNYSSNYENAFFKKTTGHLLPGQMSSMYLKSYVMRCDTFIMNADSNECWYEVPIWLWQDGPRTLIKYPVYPKF